MRNNNEKNWKYSPQSRSLVLKACLYWLCCVWLWDTNPGGASLNPKKDKSQWRQHHKNSFNLEPGGYSLIPAGDKHGVHNPGPCGDKHVRVGETSSVWGKHCTCGNKPCSCRETLSMWDIGNIRWILDENRPKSPAFRVCYRPLSAM